MKRRQKIKAKQNKIIVIFGRKGSGKTTLAKNLLEKWRKDFIIWDFIGEYKNAVIIEDYNVFADYITERIVSNKKTACIVRLPLEQFDNVCKLVRIKSNLLFLIEEVDAVSSPNLLPVELAYLIRYGRHYGVNIIAISRRPAEVPRLLTSQADTIYIAKFTEPNDVKYIQDFTEFPRDTIKTIPHYKFLKKELTIIK